MRGDSEIWCFEKSRFHSQPFDGNMTRPQGMNFFPFGFRRRKLEDQLVIVWRTAVWRCGCAAKENGGMQQFWMELSLKRSCKRGNQQVTGVYSRNQSNSLEICLIFKPQQSSSLRSYCVAVDRPCDNNPLLPKSLS